MIACTGCGMKLQWFNAHELADGTFYGDGCCPGQCDRPDKHERNNMKYRTAPRVAYLASRFERKEELQHHEEFLKLHNVMPGTRWLHAESDMRESDEDARRKFAKINFEDVLNADFLITWSEDLHLPYEEPPFIIHEGEPYVPAIWARGGRHVEFGLALGAGIDIVVIGPMENIFHYYDGRSEEGKAKGVEPQIRHFNSVESFAAWYDENNVLPDDAEPADQPGEEMPAEA